MLRRKEQIRIQRPRGKLTILELIPFTGEPQRGNLIFPTELHGQAKGGRESMQVLMTVRMRESNPALQQAFDLRAPFNFDGSRYRQRMQQPAEQNRIAPGELPILAQQYPYFCCLGKWLAFDQVQVNPGADLWLGA